MTETEAKIVDAAIQTFLRYGARKTTMADIAETAGVSRQTLYDAFGNKDEVIRASIRAVTDRSLVRARTAVDQAEGLAARLRAYLDQTIGASFDLMQTASNAEELISGHNEAGKDEIARSHERHETLVSELLSGSEGSIRTSGQSVDQLAHFVVTTAMGYKSSAKDRADLDALMTSLITAVVILAGQQMDAGG